MEVAMEDRRHEPRHEASIPVRVVVVKSRRHADGRLVNASSDGARIAVPLDVEPLQKIDLVFSDHEPWHRCTVRWCRDGHIGVSFDLPH